MSNDASSSWMDMVTEEHHPYDNLDRLLRIVIRPQGMASTTLVNEFLYQQARQHAPISYEIAQVLSQNTQQSIGIFTGACDPDHYPCGENDGPIGAVVLARALEQYGHQVSLFIDPQLEQLINALHDYTGNNFPVTLLSIDNPSHNNEIGNTLDVAIAVEKGGVNPLGKLHSITGYTREGTRAKVDGVFTKVTDHGGTTISAIDGVNEIGVGLVYDAVAAKAPWTTECKCPCKGGIMCETPVTHLYPTAIANWGAYGIVAALAMYTKNPQLIHNPSTERDMEQIAMDHDARDGVYGQARLSVDGVSLETTQSMLTIMRSLVDTSFEKYTRPF